MLTKGFFDTARATIWNGSLPQSAVDNLHLIYAVARREGITDKRHMAAIFATAFLEVGRDLEPVRETFAKSDLQAIKNLDAAFAAGKLPQVSRPYWREGWFGRGYPQTTHEANYQKAEAKTGIRFTRDPSLMLDPLNAALVMVAGMKEGWFTGKKLSDYISGDKCDYKNARRIINGVDRAKTYAVYCIDFEDALRDVSLTAPVVPPPKKEEPKSMFGKDRILSILRHILTSIGGAGVVTADEWGQIVSAVMIIAGVVWGFADKNKAAS